LSAAVSLTRDPEEVKEVSSASVMQRPLSVASRTAEPSTFRDEVAWHTQNEAQMMARRIKIEPLFMVLKDGFFKVYLLSLYIYTQTLALDE
jgi:hypothetical protein